MLLEWLLLRLGARQNGAASASALIAVIVALPFNCACYAPCALAVHRYILLGPPADRDGAARPRRLVRFALGLCGLELLSTVPAALAGLAGAAAHAISTARATGLMLLCAVLVLGGIWAVLRLGLALPAIAVDRPGAWRASWAITRHHLWTIAAASLVTFIGLALGAALPRLMAHAIGGGLGAALTAAINAAQDVADAALGAALAAWLYRRFGADGALIWQSTAYERRPV